MAEPKELLQLLQATVPADTPVTVSAEIRILESVGIVTDKSLVSAMKIASLLVPPDARATFQGLINMMGLLVEMSPKASEEHVRSLNASISHFRQEQDFVLTFGTFLPICQQWLEAKAKHRTRASRKPV